MDVWNLLSDIGILLAACLFFGGLAVKLGLNSLAGYLIAGMVVGGPGSLGWVGHEGGIETLAELGVSLLLFSLGLEFSWQKVKSFDVRLVWASITQVTLMPLMCLPAAWAFGLELSVVIVFAILLTLSSTAAVLRILAQRVELDTQHGRGVVALLLVQDIAVVPFTLIVAMFARVEGGGLTGADQGLGLGHSLLQFLGGAMVLLGGLYLLLAKGAVWVMQSLAVQRNREMAMILASVTGIGSAWAAHKLGISPALGAFFAGMMLGGSRFAAQVRSDVAPLRAIMLTLFFGAAGMVADPLWMVAHLDWVVLGSVCVLLGKAACVTLLFWAFRVPLATAVTIGFSVAQVGEFAFVLGNMAWKTDLLTRDHYQLAISVTVITLFVTPMLIALTPRLRARVSKDRLLDEQSVVQAVKQKSDLTQSLGQERSRVLVLGFGPAGEAVTRSLLASPIDVDVSVVDLSPKSLKKAQQLGVLAYLGDVEQYEVLEHYGAADAQVIVLTVPGYEAAMHAVHHLMTLAPQARLIVRSRYEVHHAAFIAEGACEVISDERAAGEQLSQATIKSLQSTSWRQACE